jgi:hypothetical protein
MQVRAVPGAGLAISRLASDYLSTGGVCGMLPPPPAPPSHRDRNRMIIKVHSGGRGTHGSRVGPAAPCVFFYQGRWYILAGRLPGWCASRSSPTATQRFAQQHCHTTCRTAALSNARLVQHHHCRHRCFCIAISLVPGCQVRCCCMCRTARSCATQRGHGCLTHQHQGLGLWRSTPRLRLCCATRLAAPAAVEMPAATATTARCVWCGVWPMHASSRQQRLLPALEEQQPDCPPAANCRRYSCTLATAGTPQTAFPMLHTCGCHCCPSPRRDQGSLRRGCSLQRCQTARAGGCQSIAAVWHDLEPGATLLCIYVRLCD